MMTSPVHYLSDGPSMSLLVICKVMFSAPKVCQAVRTSQMVDKTSPALNKKFLTLVDWAYMGWGGLEGLYYSRI